MLVFMINDNIMIFFSRSKLRLEVLKELVKRGFIIVKLSTGEKHVSLNSHKQIEIYEFLEG